MRILIDLCHPAHVHFFYHPIALLAERGHELLITSRKKEIALDLLEQLKLPHQTLSSEQDGSLSGLLKELIQRDWSLVQVIRQYRPEVMTAIGGIFIAHAGFLTRTRSLVFYDTENAHLQNLLTYPLANQVVVPRCYQGWLPKNAIRYPGYHELSYLHPRQFNPDRSLALSNGLAAEQETFLIRLVAWKANHDIGEKGWSTALLRSLVAFLEKRGKVLISSESPLPEDLHCYAYSGTFHQIHHLLAYCRLYIGESATMASECAVLGVPAIYAARVGRGYTDEQERRYGLVKSLSHVTWETLQAAIISMLAYPANHWENCRKQLLQETIEVAPFVADCIQNI